MPNTDWLCPLSANANDRLIKYNTGIQLQHGNEERKQSISPFVFTSLWANLVATEVSTFSLLLQRGAKKLVYRPLLYIVYFYLP